MVVHEDVSFFDTVDRTVEFVIVGAAVVVPLFVHGLILPSWLCFQSGSIPAPARALLLQRTAASRRAPIQTIGDPLSTFIKTPPDR